MDYHKRQKDRFAIQIPNKFHPHLHHVNIFGVDYVYGYVRSAKGRLWVTGKDPYLFDYFLPERWLYVPKTKISIMSDMYNVDTKDNIHLVWKRSRIGLQPDMDPFKDDERQILEYGYNSPFEEIALAVELSQRGVPCIYPRAIYMAEHSTEISRNLFDNSRYKSHKRYVTPDGSPFLKRHRDYYIIWGYWNGPDEKLAVNDSDYYRGVDVLRAYKEKIITQRKYLSLLQLTKEKLLAADVEDLNLRGNHILITFDSDGKLLIDQEGNPEIRICNFEFLKTAERHFHSNSFVRCQL